MDIHPKTDEHESVLYAQIFDNGQWQVGIFCINDGGHLVQVMPTNATLPPTADTLPPTSTQTQAPPLAAAVVAILHTPDQQTAADALTEALRARGVNVELIAESTRSFQQTRLMPVSGESNPASLALDDLIGLGGLYTWGAPTSPQRRCQRTSPMSSSSDKTVAPHSRCPDERRAFAVVTPAGTSTP